MRLYIYIALPRLGNAADLDHQRYMAYRSKLLQDIEAGEVVGFFTDPPCETFIGHRYRDAEGAG